jgi:response regulator RpfG family c-di-GMP phosphodiesterase
VYDALTSKRCYKEASNHQYAKTIIVEESGKQFDPDVVEAFLASEDEFIEACHTNVDRSEFCTSTACL